MSKRSLKWDTKYETLVDHNITKFKSESDRGYKYIKKNK